MTLKLVVTATLIGMLLCLAIWDKKPVRVIENQEKITICRPKNADKPVSQTGQTTNHFVQATICNNNYKIQSIN